MQNFIVEIVGFIVEIHEAGISRLQVGVDKEYSLRFEKALLAGKLEENYLVPFFFTQIITHCRSKLAKMAIASKLVRILRQLLHPSNHAIIRREGLSLMMDWVKDGQSSIPELINLYASIIPISVFTLSAQPQMISSDAPVFRAPSNVNVKEQALILLNYMLNYMTYDSQADRDSTETLWNLFRTHYLQGLYASVHFTESENPSTSDDSRLQIEDCLSDNVDYHSTKKHSRTMLAPQLQQIICKYIAMWCVQPPELFTSDCGNIPPAVFIFQEILLKGLPEDLELVHIILFETFNLPLAHHAIIRTAVNVLSTWLFCSSERRPDFLNDERAKDRIAQYLNAVSTLFDGRPAKGYAAERIEVYREGLHFFRCLATEHYVPLDERGWGVLLDTLCSLVNRHIADTSYAGSPKSSFNGLNGSLINVNTHASLSISNITNSSATPSSPVSSFSSNQLSADLEQLVIETLIGSFVRSRCFSHWDRLVGALSSAAMAASPSVIVEWSKAVYALTDLFLATHLSVDQHMATLLDEDQYLAESTRGRQARRLHMSGTIEMASPISSCVTTATEIVAWFNSGLIQRSLALEGLHFHPAARQMLLAKGTMVFGLTNEILIKNSSQYGGSACTSPSGSQDRFTHWMDLEWTRDNIVSLWRRMLRAIGDPNSIEDPHCHFLAVEVFVAVTERMIAVRRAQPFIARPIPPMFETAEILLNVCGASPQWYQSSRCLAYSALCRMFFSQHGISPAHSGASLLPRFYLVLLNGLSDKDDPVATVIIIHASRLFSLSCVTVRGSINDGASPVNEPILPGAQILVPALLKCFSAMLNAPLPVDRAAALVPMIRLGATAAALTNAFSMMRVPRIEAPIPMAAASMPLTSAGEIELESLQMAIKDLMVMVNFQAHTRTDRNTHAVLIAAVGVLLADLLLAHANPRETLIDSYLDILLDHLLPKDGPVLPIVFDQFRALASYLPLLGTPSDGVLDSKSSLTQVESKSSQPRFGAEREVMVVQRFVTSIRSAFADVEGSPQHRDELVAQLILTLLEWLMALPMDWLIRHYSLREQVFAVLEEALRRSDTVASKIGATQSSTTAGSSLKGPIKLSGVWSLTKEAAEFAIMHLLHHLRNFGPEYGSTVISSRVEECLWRTNSTPDAPSCIYLALDDTAIMCIQQLLPNHSNSNKSIKNTNTMLAGGSKQRPQVRILVRNAAGRFSWDAHSFFESFDERISSAIQDDNVSPNENYPENSLETWREAARLKVLFKKAVEAVENDVISKFGCEDSVKSFEEFYLGADSLEAVEVLVVEDADNSVSSSTCDEESINTPSSLNDCRDFSREDPLLSLLEYIQSRHEPCEELASTQPATVDESRALGVEKMSVQCQNHRALELNVAKTFVENSTTHEFASPSRLGNGGRPLHTSSPCSEKIPFQFGRQLLSALGFLAPRTCGQSPGNVALRVLSKTSGLLRDLEELDKKGSRDVFKVGVFYVAPGQETEDEILSNKQGSLAYEEFLSSLAWPVKLAVHQAYTGGLDEESAEETLYYCSSTTEVVFHDPARLLCDGPSDTRMIGKKRHLANDYVHIVWNEHSREYRPETIRGDYGNAQIVISPTSSDGKFYIDSIYIFLFGTSLET